MVTLYKYQHWLIITSEETRLRTAEPPTGRSEPRRVHRYSGSGLPCACIEDQQRYWRWNRWPSFWDEAFTNCDLAMKRHIFAFPGTNGLGSFQDIWPVCNSDKYEDVTWSEALWAVRLAMILMLWQLYNRMMILHATSMMYFASALPSVLVAIHDTSFPVSFLRVS